ncbi:MAG: hypothetical protein V1787_04415 [Candidatus Micrarchaeota archaeon]
MDAREIRRRSISVSALLHQLKIAYESPEAAKNPNRTGRELTGNWRIGVHNKRFSRETIGAIVRDVLEHKFPASETGGSVPTFTIGRFGEKPEPREPDPAHFRSKIRSSLTTRGINARMTGEKIAVPVEHKYLSRRTISMMVADIVRSHAGESGLRPRTNVSNIEEKPHIVVSFPRRA